jgi:hypothetical protein
MRWWSGAAAHAAKGETRSDKESAKTGNPDRELQQCF